MNTDYDIDAIRVLLHEECILKGYYPLIPFRDVLVDVLKKAGCSTKSDAMKCDDQVLHEAGLTEAGIVHLFRKFLGMYDVNPQKLKEIESVCESTEEAAVFRELYLLPGVKCTRARLYVRAGFLSLEDIAGASAEEMLLACERVIQKDGLALKAPFMKEIRTHIAVAKAFTGDFD